MTNEEVIEIITNALQADESKYTVEIDRALAVVQTVMMKKVPKKPHRIFNSETLHCPVCECEVGYDNDFTSKWRHCPDCGQALEWSEEAENALNKITHDALEKQMPKKPIPTEEQHIRYSMNYICPLCGKQFSGTGIADYCYHCGQALDWSDEKL